MSSNKLFAPSAERNKDPIVQVLRQYLSLNDNNNNTQNRKRTILEISSGTGQHCVHFARNFPQFTFQPSEYDTKSFASIEAYARDEGEQDGANNIALPPLHIDVGSDGWWLAQQQKLSPQDIFAIININMIHISPWECTQGLMRGAGQLLEPGQYLFTYGPYNVADDQFTSDSNREFHESLVARDARWGIRNISQVEREANKNGLELIDRVAMPSNNFTLVFQKK